MAKQHKQESWLDLLLDIAPPIGGLFGLYLMYLYLVDKNKLKQLIIYLVVIAIAIIIFALFKKYINKIKEQKVEALFLEHRTQILDAIQKAGRMEYLNNFITRFGSETKRGWRYRDYVFDWNRLDDLLEILNRRGVNINDDDLRFVLKYLIDKREQQVTEEGISTKPQLFANLDSADFERLLYRLFESMGYKIEHVGHPKDQGADLILNRGAERIVVQAKRFIGTPVGNKAVQEAVAARNYYNCNGAIVATSSNLTQEAINLAKSNNVYLINRKELQNLLLNYLKEYWA